MLARPRFHGAGSRRRGPLTASAFAALTGCAASAPPPEGAPRGGVVAEVHLHQWDDFSHYTAAFVKHGVPYDARRREQLVNFEVPPAQSIDRCTFYDYPRCTPACDGLREFCTTGGRCTPYEPLRLLDGGPVTITGGELTPAVRIVFDARTASYRADLPFARRAYAGGEPLQIGVGGKWVGLSAPKPLDIPRDEPLRATAPLELRWTPSGGEVRLELTVTTTGGETATIVCIGDDTGRMRVPDSLIARLPPVPHMLRLDYERMLRVKEELSPGRFVVVTAAAARFLEGRE